MKQLPNAYKEAFGQLIEILKTNPYPKTIFDLKKLKGSNNLYRIRLGSYRIVYAVFNESNAVYIAVNCRGFNIGGRIFDELECCIKDIIPVRKLFKGNKVECYSNDAVIGKSGEYCSLCKKRKHCRKRMRLMLLIHEENSETPAQMEINTNSFNNLREALEPIPENELSKTLINIKIEKQAKYLQLKFKPLF